MNVPLRKAAGYAVEFASLHKKFLEVCEKTELLNRLISSPSCFAIIFLAAYSKAYHLNLEFSQCSVPSDDIGVHVVHMLCTEHRRIDTDQIVLVTVTG